MKTESYLHSIEAGVKGVRREVIAARSETLDRLDVIMACLALPIVDREYERVSMLSSINNTPGVLTELGRLKK